MEVSMVLHLRSWIRFVNSSAAVAGSTSVDRLVTDCERDCEGGEDSCRRRKFERITRDEGLWPPRSEIVRIKREELKVQGALFE
jgi:hypothetical protein